MVVLLTMILLSALAYATDRLTIGISKYINNIFGYKLSNYHKGTVQHVRRNVLH